MDARHAGDRVLAGSEGRDAASPAGVDPYPNRDARLVSCRRDLAAPGQPRTAVARPLGPADLGLGARVRLSVTVKTAPLRLPSYRTSPWCSRTTISYRSGVG